MNDWIGLVAFRNRLLHIAAHGRRSSVGTADSEEYMGRITAEGLQIGLSFYKLL